MQPRIRVMFSSFTFTGVSLIEFTAVLAVIAILVALAMPTIMTMITQHRLKAATETLYSYIQLAKLETIKRNKSVRINFKSTNGGATWCYGLKEIYDCDCTAAGSCEINHIQQSVSSSDFPDVTIETHISSPGDHFTFESTRGIMDGTFGHIRLMAGGKQSRIIVSRLGRIRYCSPAGETHVTGYSTSC